jgi:hypothetical protein
MSPDPHAGRSHFRRHYANRRFAYEYFCAVPGCPGRGFAFCWECHKPICDLHAIMHKRTCEENVRIHESAGDNPS